MDRHGSNDQTDTRTLTHVRRSRLQVLLFTSAAFGTALVALGDAAGPKIPPFQGQ
jgi:hypothetical protein